MARAVVMENESTPPDQLEFSSAVNLIEIHLNMKEKTKKWDKKWHVRLSLGAKPTLRTPPGETVGDDK